MRAARFAEAVPGKRKAHKQVMQLKIATRESLTDKAYKQLEEMIVTLQLKPGSVLAEG